MKHAHSAESNKKIKKIQFFSIFIFWVMADYIYNLRWLTWIFKCVTDQKNRSKMAKFTRKMRNELKRMKNQFSDFFGFYFWWSILYWNLEKCLG